MAGSSIIVDISYGQTRVALVENGELTEMYLEDDKYTSIIGNIYKGKVISVYPGMDAAFIDIGYEKNAFLYAGDAVKKNYFSEDESTEKEKHISINDVIKPGQEILVQVMKEPSGTKGPRVTTNITLPGRDIVFIPEAEYVGISRRIEQEEERLRLKTEIEKIRPKGHGIIVRTAAEGLREADFKSDIEFLQKVWSKIKEHSGSTRAPSLVHKDFNLLYRIVRDMFTLNVSKFIINNREEFVRVQELAEMIMPALKSRVEYYDKNYNIFEYYQINSKFYKILSRKVWLKSGGYIVIDQTEALTVIDVNSGKYVGSSNLEETIFKINLEAAKEIAKQLRIRDIGGIIIIDFIDMLTEEHRLAVLEELKSHLKRDRTKTNVLGLSQLGLVEMTRKKIRQNLSHILQSECQCCGGTGKVAHPDIIAKEIQRQIEKMFTQAIAGGVIVEAHEVIIKEIESNKEEYIDTLKRRFNKPIILKIKHTQIYEDFEVKDVDTVRFLC